MIRRFCQRGFLKPEKVEEYSALHAAAWPDVLKTIRECNLQNYSISILGEMVVAYFEYTGEDYEADMRKMEAAPVTQEWWKHTKPCFARHDEGVYYEDMDCLLYTSRRVQRPQGSQHDRQSAAHRLRLLRRAEGGRALGRDRRRDHAAVSYTHLDVYKRQLEESEEGFWYCECEGCRHRWHKDGAVPPGEAKHAANIWLRNRIYEAVRKVNPNAVIGIRAFRQPPLEKDPEFLRQTAESMPKDIMLFWAPGLYVPETEFPKWCEAFGRDRVWARDTEANSITSSMGRLYRTFKSNMLRYEAETNEQLSLIHI